MAHDGSLITLLIFYLNVSYMTKCIYNIQYWEEQSKMGDYRLGLHNLERGIYICIYILLSRKNKWSMQALEWIIKVRSTALTSKICCQIRRQIRETHTVR